jgi:hypothetical protein
MVCKETVNKNRLILTKYILHLANRQFLLVAEIIYAVIFSST